MGAVMSHLASRVYAVLKQQRPYRLKDVNGLEISMVEGRNTIREKYKVPEEIRILRRQHQRPDKRQFEEELMSIVMGHSHYAETNGATDAPQQGDILLHPRDENIMPKGVSQLVDNSIDII